MMIVDYSRLAEQAGHLPHLEAALQSIQQLKELIPGKYPFEGGFFLVQTGSTQPADAIPFEAHQQYIDVQYLVKGKEWVQWADIQRLQVTEAYDPEKDRALLEGEGSWTEILPGMCYVFTPEDAHKACRHIHQPTEFTKIVIKLQI